MNHILDELATGTAIRHQTEAFARPLYAGLLAFALTTTPVPAQLPITINSGADDTGAPLATYAVDPHFTLISSADPRFPGPLTEVVDDTLFPIATGNWIASATSKWIAPQGNQDYLISPDYGDAVGDYTYRVTFDLTGYDPELVRLAGQWTADSVGIDILINGASTGFSISTNLLVPLQWWHSFAISTGFVQGTNTLDFVVQRLPWGGSTYLPTGLRAEFVITNLPPPQLQISAARPFVLVSWPTNTPAFTLEISSRLGKNQNWSLFRGPITAIGGQNVVVADTANGPAFFRLHKR
jgi:hypothetical protein